MPFVCLEEIRRHRANKNRYGTGRKQSYFRFSSRQTAQGGTQKAGSVGGMVVPTGKLHAGKHLQGVPLTLPQYAPAVPYQPSPQPRLFPRLLQLSEYQKIKIIGRTGKKRQYWVLKFAEWCKFRHSKIAEWCEIRYKKFAEWCIFRGYIICFQHFTILYIFFFVFPYFQPTLLSYG